ncbi:hypothetical protein JOM56_011164 [Amanita muscaria]
MVMRYFGGGVGHASTREATNFFLLDHHRQELEDSEHIIPGEDDSEASRNVPTANQAGEELINVEEDYGYCGLSENESEHEIDPDEEKELDLGEEAEAEDEEYAEL